MVEDSTEGNMTKITDGEKEKMTQSEKLGVDAKQHQAQQEHQKNVGVVLKILAKGLSYDITIERRTQMHDLSNDIDGIINEISKSKLITAETSIVKEKTTPQFPEKAEVNPIQLLAMKLGVDENAFEKLKIISIKNETAQILKPSLLKPSENCYLLLAASEFVLHRESLPYDEWKLLCEASNIKSKTPFVHIVKNAKNYGHIDKKLYESSRQVTLSPRGVEVITKALQNLINNN